MSSMVIHHRYLTSDLTEATLQNKYFTSIPEFALITVLISLSLITTRAIENRALEPSEHHGCSIR